MTAKTRVAQAISQLPRVAAIVLSAAALAQIALLFWLRAQPRIYRLGADISLTEGYSPDGRLISIPKGRCLLLRITSDDCPYCRQDKAAYKLAAQAGLGANCAVVELGPRHGDIRAQSEPGITQLQFIDMRLGDALNPLATPQTLLVDKKGKLLWQRQGVLDSGDVAELVRLMEPR